MIQSISDIITNSSSEVFIISSHDHETVSKFIKDICNICKLNMDEIIDMYSATKSEKLYDEFPVKKGDLVVEGTYDNSIPFPIMDLLENLDYLPCMYKTVTNVKRYHNG